MQISFSPNITSIYILYKDIFTKSDVDFCVDLRADGLNVFIVSNGF